MKQEIAKKWEEAAWALQAPYDRLPVPFHVIMGEAVDVARFCQRNWQPATDHSGRVLRPGMKTAVGNGLFTEATAAETLELLEVLQDAQTHYRLLVNSPASAPVERAQFILSEIRAALEWYFDDGVQDVTDVQLDALNAAHEAALSQDALAAALFDYAELASRHRTAIHGLGGFDAALIDEATVVARMLREHSAGPAEPAPAPAAERALELRNRLATLLQDRVQRIRGAARFVFRRHPDIVRQVTSAYARRQKAAQRARAAANSGAPAQAEAPAENVW